jgi:excisionase family DNA binding protein
MSDHVETPTMTVPELAERVGVDVSTAYRYLRAGTLPGVQAGSSWLIDRERVTRFMGGLEDAAGMPLVRAPATADAPELTLLPPRVLDDTGLAMAWLRGAHAALGLLLETADRAPSARNDAGRHHLSGA